MLILHNLEVIPSYKCHMDTYEILNGYETMGTFKLTNSLQIRKISLHHPPFDPAQKDGSIHGSASKRIIARVSI
jgi:hypothetical protein